MKRASREDGEGKPPGAPAAEGRDEGGHWCGEERASGLGRAVERVAKSQWEEGAGCARMMKTRQPIRGERCGEVSEVEPPGERERPESPEELESLRCSPVPSHLPNLTVRFP